MTLLAALSAVLTACASGPADPGRLTGPAPDPVVETRTLTRVLCPDEIWRPLPPEPDPAADAEVIWNTAGGLWIDGQLVRGQAAIDALESAREACLAAGAIAP